MSNFNDFLNEQLQNSEFKAEYDALEEEFELIQQEIDKNKNEKITPFSRLREDGVILYLISDLYV